MRGGAPPPTPFRYPYLISWLVSPLPRARAGEGRPAHHSACHTAEGDRGQCGRERAQQHAEKGEGEGCRFCRWLLRAPYSARLASLSPHSQSYWPVCPSGGGIWRRTCVLRLGGRVHAPRVQLACVYMRQCERVRVHVCSVCFKCAVNMRACVCVRASTCACVCGVYL